MRTIRTSILASAAFILPMLAVGEDCDSPVAAKIAETCTVKRQDEFYGFKRVVFDFNGHDAWVVLPKAEPAKGNPWTWCMQWATAYVPRTNVLKLLESGWHHVTINTFRHRMDEEGIRVSAEFQEFLVTKLGFAPKACLVGMSWGGFFSVRYAAAHPENVGKVYLDAPLLNFDGFAKSGEESTPTASAARIGPWATMPPEFGWTDDPRMPVNMAGKVAKAGIPVLLLYGGQDQTVPPVLNAELFASRFRAAHGDIKVVNRSLYGHHPHGVAESDDTIKAFFEGDAAK